MSIKNYTALFKIQVAEQAAETGIFKTARIYQLNRKTVAEWLKKYHAGGSETLSTPSIKSNAHLKTVSDSDIEAIYQLKSSEPQLTAADIKKRLNLSCSTRTIQLKLQKFKEVILSSKQLQGFSLVVQIERLKDKSSSQLPDFIIKAREIISGKIYCCFCNENTSINLGIFISYLLSNLNISGSGKIITGLGRFNSISQNRLSFFEETINQHANISIEKSDNKITIFPFSLHKKKYKGISDFLNSVYLFLDEFKRNNTDSRQTGSLPLFPIITDKFVSSAQEIKKNTVFWQQSNLKLLNNPVDYWEKILDDAKENLRLFRIEKAISCLNKILEQKQLEFESCFIEALLQSSLIKLRTGAYTRAEQFLHTAKRLIDIIGDRQLEVKYLLSAAKYHSRTGNTNYAFSMYEELIIRKQELSLQSKVDLFLNIALLYRRMGNISKAEFYNLEACRVTKNHTGDNSHAAALSRTGVFYSSQGNFGKAEEYFEMAKQAIKSDGNNEFIAKYYLHTGDLYFSIGQYAEAEIRLRKAISCSQQSELKDDKTRSYILLALQQASIGLFDDARVYFKKAKDLSEASGFVSLLFKIRRCGAFINSLQGLTAKAIHYYELSLKLAKELGDYEGYILDTGNLAISYRKLGNLDKAMKFAKLQKQSAVKFNNPRLIAAALNNLASVYLQKAENNKAASLYGKLINLADQYNYTEYSLIGRYNAAFLYFSFTPQKAIKLLNDLIKISNEKNNSNYIAEAALLLAELYFKQQNTHAAKQALDTSQEFAIKTGNTAVLTKISTVSKQYQ